MTPICMPTAGHRRGRKGAADISQSPESTQRLSPNSNENSVRFKATKDSFKHTTSPPSGDIKEVAQMSESTKRSLETQHSPDE